MQKPHLVLLLILSGFVATGAWLSVRSTTAKGSVSENPPVPVGFATAVRRDVPVYLYGLGNVEAYNVVTVRAQVDGQITEVVFKEGQEIKEGDVLVRIDPRIYQASLDQAAAKKAQDEAQLANARRDLLRYRTLIEKNSVARQQLDTTEALVAQFEASVKGDEAAIEYAQVNLGYTTIRSPLEGRAGIRLVDSGNIVHANDTNGLVTVTQTRPISVLFTLPEDSLPNIIRESAKGPIEVAALSRDGQDLFDLGELALIDNAIDQTTGTIKLKATMPNEAGLLWPGQFITVRLLQSTLRHALTVPVTALQNGPDGRFVFLVNEDHTVAVRKLKLGQVDAETAVVEEGLKEGDFVVTSGQYRLQSGTRVDVADNATQPSPVGAK